MESCKLSQTVIDAGLLEDMWEKAIVRLERRLTQPGNHTIQLERLGQLYRRTGNLTAAADAYQRLSQIAPGHPMAAYLHRLLAGLALGEQPTTEAFRPAPFVRISNFLPTSERRQLFDIA
ncbi:hypothetical protein C2W62_50610, partial [Candidatus Entotheonella serta]